MEEVRQLVQEEGREARNLVAFHVAVDTPARVSRKPPRGVAPPPPRRTVPRAATRLRSASAGRDKRSELRARYWALLFGEVQRAVGEIYNTVEAHENLNECQEVILVLENYTRDFKALGEWFRLKWEYDNTPPPQRPHSLAWEIRKTDFVRPESRRAHSVKSSPSVSGKNSPCFSGHNTPSGKNSPNLTGKASPGSGKISPRGSGHSNSSPKGNIEFFSNKIASKITAKPEPKSAKDISKLSDIKEKDVKENAEDIDTIQELKQPNDVDGKLIKQANVEIGKAKECPNTSPKMVVIKSPKRTVLQEDSKQSNESISSQAKATIAKLDAMENEFLAKHITENAAKNENQLNIDKEFENKQKGPQETNIGKNIAQVQFGDTTPEVVEAKVDEVATDDNEKDIIPTASPVNSEDNFADVSNESSSRSIDEKLPLNDETKINDTLILTEPTANSEVNKQGNPSALSIKDEEKGVKLHVSTKETLQDKEIKLDNVKQAADVKKSQEPAKESDILNKEPKATGAKGIKNGLDSKKIINDAKQAAEVKKSKEPKISNSFENSESKDFKKDPDSNKVILDDVKQGDGVKESDISLKETEISEAKDMKKDQDSKKIDQKNITEKPNTRPAYSQAAAKPKPVTIPKTEVKTPTRLIIRSKTVVEMRPNSVPKPPRQFPKRNLTNKCSYPFNLTTGRTSLFDGPSNKAVSKKPMNRQATGDVKTNAKADIKKRPLRPTTLKINEKGDKKESTNPSLEKIKDCEEYSSSDTIVTQIDMCRIESSESLKTLVPEDFDEANSIEVLNVDNIKSDNDGWLTVKSRRLSRESKKQSKSHWANRFHQPSATTSLPTLNMIESPKQEMKQIVEITKLDRAKSEQPQNKPEKPKVSKPKEAKKDLAMIRQKSDVTGLKTRTSRTKALKREKVKDTRKDNGELTKNRLHSSLESLATGLARSQESTEEAFDFDKWKAEFKSTFNFLEEDDQISDHNEILKSADPSEMSEIAEMTSQIEENERKISWALDFQSEVDQRKLCEEEDLLNRQIMELQQVSDIDLDTETDDTETDAEILCDDARAGPSCQSTENLSSLTASLEDQYETALAGMSWAERVDTLGVLEALVARDPGRAQQLHAKLSQGIKRRGSLQDALRRLQAKQARAERQRLEYQTERARKIHQLLARVEEVKVAKDQLIDEKRMRMERRLQKAAENRDQHLKDIVRKAHDEEEKLREIAFIKQLEAENRRHEFLDQCRSHTTRLRQMRRDRLSKLEQKAAREAAVGARRQAIEDARKLHVKTLLEKRKERDARLEELKEQKKQERDDAAREKAEGVKSRLSALAAAAQLEAVALRSRIRDKQDASQLRLESHLQAIREKATGPRLPTTSESQDQSTKEEKEVEEEAARLEQERKDREKQKAIKKKARKVKQKLLSTSNESRVMEELALHTEHPLPGSSKMMKVIHQLSNILAPLQDSETTDKINENGGTEDTEKTKKRNKKQPMNGDSVQNNNNEVLKPEDAVSKKKKKKNDKCDKPKLSKTSSVCSSLSDMSKGSGHIERRSKPVIDLPYLERQLNELHRMMEKYDKFDKCSMAKVLAVKVLGQFLAVAAEREDLASQLTTRSLTTAVVAAARAVGTCAASAAYFLGTGLGAHAAKLLADQLEKDLQSDAKELELSKQLSDCLSIALDSALCTTRVCEQTNDVPAKELELLADLRSRAHTLISYLCLSGCITRAEKAGEAREGIQTLLTVSADLCHPCPVDVGSDRASAVQSIRCALGTGVCGSRAEFCMLFAQGAELQHSGGFVRAARTTHLLRGLAELDHQIVQEAFGEGGWPLEFRAAVARLLSQHAPNDKEAPRATALRLCNQRLDQTVSETMVLDLIVLVGFVVVNNPQLQETICDGWSVIKTLCTLPANWLISKPHCHALLPTLVALSGRPTAAAAIAAELSVGMLEEYMNSPEAQNIKLVQVIKQGRAKKPGKK